MASDISTSSEGLCPEGGLIFDLSPLKIRGTGQIFGALNNLMGLGQFKGVQNKGPVEYMRATCLIMGVDRWFFRPKSNSLDRKYKGQVK
jgi:hypothetical protein